MKAYGIIKSEAQPSFLLADGLNKKCGQIVNITLYLRVSRK